MDYPIWDLPIGGGVLIGIIAIAHVIVAHFAVGGGLVIAVVETLAERRGDGRLRELARRSSLMLILVSTVFGAISGVGIWVTIGLVQPAATSALIHSFLWGWAAEWGFFVLEVATALLYYATWDRVRPRTHVMIIWLYAFAAYASLVVIQGIVSFMLTPGRWIVTRSFWDGIFNPSYFPGLLLRTGAALLLAGACLTFAALREPDGASRGRLVRILAGFEAGGAILAFAGYLGWESSLPSHVAAIFRGASPLLPPLAATTSLGLWALAACLLLAVVALLLPKAQRRPTAAVGLIAAALFLGSYERIREGARKPWVLRDFMFSNGVLVGEIGDLNRLGILSKAGWAARERDGTTAPMGRAVFRAECSSCHTLDGYLSIRRIVAPMDAESIEGFLKVLRAQGDAVVRAAAEGAAVDTRKLDFPLMPPLVGTGEEVEALARYLGGMAPAKTTEVRHDR